MTVSLQNDIRTTLELTFEVCGEPYFASGARRGWWPTEIRVYDNHHVFRPLQPTLFEFRTPSQNSLNRILMLPIHICRSLRVNVITSTFDSSEEFLRLYNSILWLLELLNTMGSCQLPSTTTAFSEPDFEVLWERTIIRKKPVIDYLDDHPLACFEVNPNDTNFWILLRGLRMLRNVKQLFIIYPQDLSFEKLKVGRYKIEPAIDEIKSMATSRTPYGASDHDHAIQIEINLRTTFFELYMTRHRGLSLLRKERFAFWSDSYEQAVRKRLDLTALANEETPSFVRLAHRKLSEQRRLAEIYNPLGRPFIAIHGYTRSAVEYQENLRREVGADPNSTWSQKAWLFDHPQPSSRRYGIKIHHQQLVKRSVPRLGSPPSKNDLKMCKSELAEAESRASWQQFCGHSGPQKHRRNQGIT